MLSPVISLGAFAQGHKDPMTDSLSGYVSVSLHHTPIDVVGEGTEVSLQAAGEKSHIHQFA